MKMNDKWFNYLEDLRMSGATNMFGAVPYLVEEFDLTRKEATDVLAYWMKNYEELSERLSWKR